MPTGMSWSEARRSAAASLARSMRVGELCPLWASIERETSTTNHTSVSVRTMRVDVRSSTG